MIRTLRRNFIALAMLTLVAAMAVVMLFVYNLAGFRIARQYDVLLEWMLECDGSLPSALEEMAEDQREDLGPIPEILYETRHFSVVMEEDGTVSDLRLSSIHSVDCTEAAEMAAAAREDPDRKGSLREGWNIYFFRWEQREDGSVLLVFIDATSRIWVMRSMSRYMLLVAAIVLFLYFFLYFWYSKKIVRPYQEAQERQRRFVTNAGHELKTPLAVIAANTEMAEAVSGETRWTRSTLRQVRRMDGLVQELVTLARLEEKETPELTRVDWSRICAEEAESFREVICAGGKSFRQAVTPGLFVRGEEKALRQLVTILLDNAAKYCDAGGDVRLVLEREKRSAVLSVTNRYEQGAGVDCSRFFERFYRGDESHSGERPGYGVGLSIAQQTVQVLGGTIRASWQDGEIRFTVALRESR